MANSDSELINFISPDALLLNNIMVPSEETAQHVANKAKCSTKKCSSTAVAPKQPVHDEVLEQSLTISNLRQELQTMLQSVLLQQDPTSSQLAISTSTTSLYPQITPSI